MIKHCGLILFLVLAQATTACNSAKTTTNTGTSAKQTIGAKGGSLTLGTGVSLQVPPGALDKDVEIGVEEVTGTVEGFTLGSKRYKFTPEGITFAVPVVVSLEQSTPADSQSIFWTKAGGAAGYDKLATTACGKSTTGKDLFCGATSHFSEGFLGKENGPPPLTCATGQTKCGEVCADLQTATANCGACGTVCAGAQVCGAGTCQEPVRTVTLTVNAYPLLPPNPVRATNANISFVGRKVGGTWQALTATTGADTDARTYSFTTQELTYEVAVGCETTDGETYYDVDHFLKSTVDSPTLTVTCGPPPVPAVDPEATITLQGRLLASGPTGPSLASSGYQTTLQQGTCYALNEGAQPCDEVPATNGTFDVIYGNAENIGILRGVVAAPSGPSALMPLDMPIADAVATRSATVVFALGANRTAGDFLNNVVRADSSPASELYFGTSRGTFVQSIGTSMSALELQPALTTDRTLSFTSSSIFGGTAETTDVHTFQTFMYEYASSIEWNADTHLRGNVADDTTRNVTLPASFSWTFDEDTGALTGVPTAGSVSASSDLQESSLRWHFHIDAAAVPSGSNYPLAPQDLSAIITDGDEGYYSFATNEFTVSSTSRVSYETQDSDITAIISAGVLMR